jgi:WD40 repeat protein
MAQKGLSMRLASAMLLTLYGLNASAAYSSDEPAEVCHTILAGAQIPTVETLSDTYRKLLWIRETLLPLPSLLQMKQNRALWALPSGLPSQYRRLDEALQTLKARARGLDTELLETRVRETFQLYLEERVQMDHRDRSSRERMDVSVLKLAATIVPGWPFNINGPGYDSFDSAGAPSFRIAGNYVITQSETRSFRDRKSYQVAQVWHSRTGDFITDLDLPTNSFEGAVLTPQADSLVVYGDRGEVEIRSTDTLKVERSFRLPATQNPEHNRIYRASVTGDGRYLIAHAGSSIDRSYLYFWDLFQSGTITGVAERSFQVIGTADASRVIVLNRNDAGNYRVQLWNPLTDEVKPLQTSLCPLNRLERITDVYRLSPDRRWIVLKVGHSLELWKTDWPASAARKAFTLSEQIDQDHPHYFAFGQGEGSGHAPTQDTLVDVNPEDHRVPRLIDLTTLNYLKLQPAAWDITAFAFHPSLNLLAAGTAAGTLAIWDVRTGQLLDETGGASEATQYVEFTPDGHRVIQQIGFTQWSRSQRPGSLLIWDLHIF